jgi:hypothetical protein
MSRGCVSSDFVRNRGEGSVSTRGKHLYRLAVAATAIGWVWSVCAAARAGTITFSSISLSATQVGLYQPLTIRFNLSKSYSNPYDPELVDARFEFTGPSGTARVIPAFYAGGSPAWQARIVPLELGAHSCRILVSDSAGDSGSYSVAFTGLASTAPGFIRIDSRNPRYLQFDNGQPYHPVGQNVCWYGGDGNFTNWLNNMATAGENWARYWVLAHAGQDIEWGGGTSYQLGRYSQTNAQLLDNMFEAVRTRGIYVQACLDSFNGWNLTLWSNWSENPYNAANGGMCGRPNDYFVNAEAQRYAKRRFRYIVARWAYDPAILCWEFFNEVDAVGGGGATFWGHENEIAAWHQTMAQYIRSIDPFQHLRSTSFADDGPRTSYDIFWQLPEMDIVQVHQYSIILPQEHVGLIRAVRKFGKPVIMGEGDYAGDPGTLDTNGQSLHDMIWAAAVIESGAMSWWWDNWIHPHNLYYRFTPLAAFLSGEDWAPQRLDPLNCTILSGPTTPEIYGSGSPAHAYVYIRDWQGPVSGLRLRFNQLRDTSSHQIECWDTQTQSPYRTDTVAGSATGLVLDVPNFARDIAMKIRALGPEVSVSPVALAPQAFIGTNPPPQSFTIRNAGVSTLQYVIATDADWLSVTPQTGEVTVETDTITVNYTTDGLAAAVYPATITVAGPEGTASPATIAVSLTVRPLPGDLDGDGDADQSDFGLLQACQTGSGVIQDAPACDAAHLDTDADVDSSDVSLFLKCMAGSGVPVDPHCLE